MKIESKALELMDLSFSRNSQIILDRISLRVEASEIASLVGPSGAGKTSLLRLIAGFEKPTGGVLTLGDRLLASDTHFVSPEKRSVGIVFQDFALFPHLTVRENLLFGLFKIPAIESSKRLAFLSELLSLGSLLHRYPHELSGGQQQRVAIGRALAPEPSLLLLDEPFSQLDPELREELIESLGKVMRETRITTLLVTHHQEDAFDLSDKLGVLNKTHLEQWGSPYDLYHNPKTRFVADFIGKGVFLNATLLGDGRVQTELGVFSDPALREVTFHKPCQLLVRPDDVVHDDAANLKARLIQKRFRGSMHLYTLELPSGNRVLSYVPSHHNHAIGEWIGIRVDMDHVNVYES
jgi:iron(III) transport system ATP-binding protein